MTALEPLLTLQEHDLALDRLRHRRATLPERAALAAAETRANELQAAIERLRAERDEIAREEQRFDDEARRLADQATAAEQRLYSGEISSPRELQALQADVVQLQRRQRDVEDRQLAAMERREPLDARLAALATELRATHTEAAAERDALGVAEVAIDAEAAAETIERAAVAGGLDDELVAEYERCRVKANGNGAARLVGSTCQGCHLTIPATEVDRIHKAPPGSFSHCDNCGCILVP